MRTAAGNDALKRSLPRGGSTLPPMAAVSPYNQRLSKKSRRKKGGGRSKGKRSAKPVGDASVVRNSIVDGSEREGGSATSAFEEKAGFDGGQDEESSKPGKEASENRDNEQREVGAGDMGQPASEAEAGTEETQAPEELSLAVATVAIDVVDSALRAASPGLFSRPETEEMGEGEEEEVEEEPERKSKAEEDPFGFLKAKPKKKKKKRRRRNNQSGTKNREKGGGGGGGGPGGGEGGEDVVETTSATIEIKESASTPQLPQISQRSPARRQPGVRLVYKKKKKRQDDPTTKRLRRLAASLDRLGKAKNGGSLAELDQLDIAGDGTLLRRTSPSKSASTPNLGSKKGGGVSEALLLRYGDVSINRTLDMFLRKKGEEGEEAEGEEHVV